MFDFTFDWQLEPMDEWIIYLDKANIRYWFAGYGHEGERRWVKSQADAMIFRNKDAALEMFDEIDMSNIALACYFPQ